MTVRGVEREVKDSSRQGAIYDDPFVEDFNMTLAQPHSKSVRLNGLATCLRLEKVYWNILAGIANSNHCSVNAVLSYIDREVHLRYGGVKNFSGLIRVVCVPVPCTIERSSGAEALSNFELLEVKTPS